MLIPDINILVYAYNVNAPQHQLAREWWERSLGESRPIGLPWVTALGFLRVMTHRSILASPIPAADAIDRVKSWLDHPRVRIVNPGERHAEILFHLLTTLGIAGNLTTDAHLAALAIEYQAELVSADADFSRFPGVRWSNPLPSRR